MERSAKIKKNQKKFTELCHYIFFPYNCTKFLNTFHMTPNPKKRLVVSFNNLPLELQEELKALYPAGYYDVMMRIDKPNGDFFYAVPFETEEVSYLVKIDVKIDDLSDEDDDKDYYDDELKGADEIQDDGSDDEPMSSSSTLDDYDDEI